MTLISATIGSKNPQRCQEFVSTFNLTWQHFATDMNKPLTKACSRHLGRTPCPQRASDFCYLAAVIAPCLLTTFGPAQADEQFTATKIVQIPGKPLASFDIGYVDAAINTYVLADRSNAAVDVVNTRSNAFIRQLTGCGGNVALPTCSVFAGPITSPANSAGPNGVIIVDHKEVWAGDGVPPGSTSKVHVINLRNNHLIASVDTGGHFRADELCEDTRRELVLIANDDPADSFLTFISSESHAIVGKIKLDGTDSNGKNIKANGIEQCQNSARNGKFYLAVPDVGGGTNGVNGSTGHDGAVLVISATKPFKVERVFPVAASTGCRAARITIRSES